MRKLRVIHRQRTADYFGFEAERRPLGWCGRCKQLWPCPTVRARRAGGERDNPAWWQFWVRRRP